MGKIMQGDRHVEFWYFKGVCDPDHPESLRDYLRFAEKEAWQAKQNNEFANLLKYQLFICKYLHAHFGEASVHLQQEIMRTHDEEILSEMVYRLFQIRTLDDAKMILQKNK